MSRTSDAVQLVNRLIQRTSEGSLLWNRGITPNEYSVQSGDYRFVLSKDLFATGLRLQVFNAASQMVEELRTDQNPFEQGGLNVGPIRARLQALWATVTGTSDELKKILKSI